jgi:hypothetical protein
MDVESMKAYIKTHKKPLAIGFAIGFVLKGILS